MREKPLSLRSGILLLRRFMSKHPVKLTTITNPTHCQIVSLLTTKLAPKLNAAAKTKLGTFITKFSLIEIPLADIVAQTENIRTNADETLPHVLQFDRPISRSCLEFAIALWTHQRLFDSFPICQTRRSNDEKVRDDCGVIADVRDLEDHVDERRAAAQSSAELRARERRARRDIPRRERRNARDPGVAQPREPRAA
jgi:hypothetical protein